MEFLDTLFEDVDTPIFNAMKKEYRNPMLDFIEEEPNFYSPIFTELKDKYENPRGVSVGEVIQIPVVDYKETDDIADNEIAYLLAEKQRLEEELKNQQLTIDFLKKKNAELGGGIDVLTAHKGELIDALIKTVSYAGNEMFPPIDGWTWYDALKKFQPESAENYLKVYEESRPGPRSPLQIHADETVDAQTRYKRLYFDYLSRDPGFVSTFGDDYSIEEHALSIAQDEGSGRRGPYDPYVITLSQKIQFIPNGAQPRNENDAYSDPSHSMKGES